MALMVFKGDPKLGGIPRKSRVTIEALPKRTMIFDGIASGSVSIDADPCKYVANVTNLKDNGDGPRGASYIMTFLHECTEEQYQNLKDVAPQFSRPIITSDGLRYRCGFIGCDVDDITSRLSAALHEADHFGIDLLNDPSALETAKHQGASYNKKARAAKVADATPMRPGRG